MQHCQMDPEKIDVVLGIDGGQGMLKVGATVVDRMRKQKSGRAQYEDGVVSKKTLNTF